MLEKQIDFMTVGELADTLGVQSWRIARLFELGLLVEPPRLSGRRIIEKSQIPVIEDALRGRGGLWDKTEGGACV